MNKAYFHALCQATKIPFTLGNKIIDGRYKTSGFGYLSALDDQYYDGNDVWMAKTDALNSAIRKFGKELTIQKLSDK